MRGLSSISTVDAARALIDWWSLAGVDEAVAEAPRNWLRPVAKAAQAAPQATYPEHGDRTLVPATPLPAAPAAPVMPDTLSAFEGWLAEATDLPEAQWSTNRIAPVGNPAPALMIVSDMPDTRDMLSRTLFTDAPGRLLDSMLRAIGLERQRCYIASLSMSRAPGAVVSDADWARLAARMRRHISLVGPRRVLLLGDKTARALLSADGGQVSSSLRSVNHDGGTVSAIATYHPRFLLEHPEAKGVCWTGLRKLIEEAKA